MKIRVKRDSFANTLSDFLLVLKENPIKPILAGLKIEVKGNDIKLIGTNLESILIKRIKGEASEDGTIVIKPNLMLEYIKLLDDEFIDIYSENNSLFVHKAEFVTLNVEDYPHVGKHDSNIITKYDSEKFVTALEKCKFSAYPTADNLTLNCIRILFKNDVTEFVSTDSYRLTYYKDNVGSEKEMKFSIPFESISIATKLFKNINKEITIGNNDIRLIFEWEDTYFATRIIELPFPDFRQILSFNGFDKNIEFNTGEMKSALKKVMTVAKTSYETKYGAVFNFKNKMLVIDSQSGKGKTTQKVNIIKDGENFKGSLNIKFILEFLNNISKNLIVDAVNSSSMFRMHEENNENYIYILMPLALKN